MKVTFEQALQAAKGVTVDDLLAAGAVAAVCAAGRIDGVRQERRRLRGKCRRSEVN